MLLQAGQATLPATGKFSSLTMLHWKWGCCEERWSRKTRWGDVNGTDLNWHHRNQYADVIPQELKHKGPYTVCWFQLRDRRQRIKSMNKFVLFQKQEDPPEEWLQNGRESPDDITEASPGSCRLQCDGWGYILFTVLQHIFIKGFIGYNTHFQKDHSWSSCSVHWKWTKVTILEPVRRQLQ